MTTKTNGAHSSQKRYPPELREHAVRMVHDAIEEAGGDRYGVVTRIARQLGVGPESLRNWARQAEDETAGRANVDRRRIAVLERENRELRRTNDILKAASAFFARELDPATAEVVAFIDEHKDRRTDGLRWGVEPICSVLQFAPSTYYDARSRPHSRRSVTDAELSAEIVRVHEENFSVYGAEKIWRQLSREGISCGRDRVARLMAGLGVAGATRQRESARTTAPAESERPANLVKRDFSATAPNRLWVADTAYVPTAVGFVYTAFVIDACSRAIVGWRVSTSLRTDLALDALEMAIFSRRGADLSRLVHHSDRGVQYLTVRYSQRIEECEAVASVGSKGDSYDNALAETVNGLYKAELVHRRDRWRNAAEFELATAAWVMWWNNTRLHGSLGHVPPLEYEALHLARPEVA